MLAPLLSIMHRVYRDAPIGNQCQGLVDVQVHTLDFVGYNYNYKYTLII